MNSFEERLERWEAWYIYGEPEEKKEKKCCEEEECDHESDC